MFRTSIAAVVAAGLALAAGAASAQDNFVPKAKGQWIVNLRVSDISPHNGGNVIMSGGADTGLKADVSSQVMPSLGVTYFLTDNLAIEAIATTTRHTIHARGPGTDLLVHKTWVLPPVVALQYHPLPAARVSPYVGAGVNYMLFYSGTDYAGFKTHVNDGFGWALQGGADVAIQGPWVLNLDAKKVFFRTDASVNGGALTSHVKLDPWVLSAGFGRKF